MPTSNERKMLSSNEALKELTNGLPCLLVRQTEVYRATHHATQYRNIFQHLFCETQ